MKSLFRSESFFVELTGLIFVVCLMAMPTLTAQPPGTKPSPAQSRDETGRLADANFSDDERQQIEVADRFLTILEGNPRRGTALDRVYGHHVDFGSLDSFLELLHDRVRRSPDDGVAWMLLGLFESHRGNDGDAADAFMNAEKLRPNDAMASFYLGQSQLRIGKSDEAVLSFERGIARQPSRADMLEIYSQLGRVHQRAQRTDEALAVWKRLEALFPDDPRVLEQIAVTLAEEGQSELALSRYVKLAELVSDDYRRVMYEVAAAELRIQTGHQRAGIADFEEILAELNPDSWLYGDVRRRIDDVFLRSGDQDSLVEYYENWLAKNPKDVEGMTRLARFLNSSARVPEATLWMEKAIKLAPTRSDLRRAFIDQLVNDGRITEAIAAYPLLIESAPGNTDYLRDWGKLVLRDKEQSIEERRKKATRIWDRILELRPDDALTVSQVADLYRQNEMLERAESLYRKSIRLAPDDPQYREYLGEFLHLQKRQQEAIAVWAGIAADERRSVTNIVRLAEVYNSFGYVEKAVAEIGEAARRDPKDFSLQLRAADYQSRAQLYDDALASIASADALATSEDQLDAVIQKRIAVWQSSEQLDAQADRIASKIGKDKNATAADWYRVARYLEASRRWPDATEAIVRSIELDPKSVPALTSAARIAETSGDYGQAADTSRKLVKIDRRSRAQHLMNVARLEVLLGRSDEALAAAEELILSAPGNTEHYEFYAQMCFRLGNIEAGLAALRKAVRINPNGPHLLMTLAGALADEVRTDEAIEVYWRAFEKADEVEDKVTLTMKLTTLYHQINQFDQLIERFEHDRREDDKRRELTICLAQAWHTLGDFRAARQELESLLSEDTNDTNLLNQLAKLCQDGAELDAAIEYQRRLVAIAPGAETEYPLANMLMEDGQADEANGILVKLTQREEDPVRQMTTLDSLLARGSNETVIAIIEPLLAQDRENWELMYRAGIAWQGLDQTEKAKNYFERILSLKLPYDSLGRSAAEAQERAQSKAKSNNIHGIITAAPQTQSPLAMRTMSSRVQFATGLRDGLNPYARPGKTTQVWAPDAYAVSRMAAYGWLLRFERDAETSVDNESSNAASERRSESDTIVAKVKKRAASDDAPITAIYDSLYVAMLNNDLATQYAIARRLAAGGGLEEQRFFLSSLDLRKRDVAQFGRPSYAAKTIKAPLSEDDLQLMRDCYESLASTQDDHGWPPIHATSVVVGANGQSYLVSHTGLVALSGVVSGGFFSTVVAELRLAGADDEARAMIDKKLQSAESAAELGGAMSLLLQEDRQDEMAEYFDRWQAAAIKQIQNSPLAQSPVSSSRVRGNSDLAPVMQMAVESIKHWMALLAVDEQYERVLTVLDRSLSVVNAEAEHRIRVAAANPRPHSRKRTSSPQTLSLTPRRSTAPQIQATIYDGTNVNAVAIEFPPASIHVDRSVIGLLRQVHVSTSSSDAGDMLVAHLRQRVAAAENAVKVATGEAGHPDATKLSGTLRFERLYLASALWWAENQDEALDLMTSVVSELSGDDELRFDLVKLHQTRGALDVALRLLNSIEPRDQQTVEQKEILALLLAERLGDTERAREAAKRLFGMRLPPEEQLNLVGRMRRLGLGDLADAVVARVERTSNNNVMSLISLMNMYQGQGKIDQANQLAQVLLQRTNSPVSIGARSPSKPRGIRSADSSVRTPALQLLKRSGRLRELIEQLETQLERSPGSIRLLDQLIEFYGVMRDNKKLGEKLRQAVELRPDSPIVHWQLAKHFELTGDNATACDEYLQLIRSQSSWVLEDLNHIQSVFKTAKREVELVEALSEMDMKSIKDPWYIIQTATRMLREKDNVEVAVKLLERAYDAFPDHRQNMLSDSVDAELFQNDRYYRFAKRAILPTKLEIAANGWAGMNSISSFLSTGKLDVPFSRMLSAVKDTPKIKDLESTIIQRVSESPDWLGGQAMLAMIELATDRPAEARTRLTGLVANDETMQSMPQEACWIIGMELDRFQETKSMAIKMFEQAIAGSSRNIPGKLESSPIVRLLEIYKRTGRRSDARDLLLAQINQSLSGNGDDAYLARQELENLEWAADRMLQLDYPLDAIDLYRRMTSDPEKIALARQSSGTSLEHYAEIARSGIAEALESVNDSNSNSNELIAKLFASSDGVGSNGEAIDLMLTVPTVDRLGDETMSSAYVDLLVQLARDPASTVAIEQGLADMAERFPEDLSIAIADAAWKLRRQPDISEAAVAKLTEWVENHPLEKLATDARPNARQRREAASSIPLWIVARECLRTADAFLYPPSGRVERSEGRVWRYSGAHPRRSEAGRPSQEESEDDGTISEKLREAGETLAERALASAARQIDDHSSISVLYEWGNVLAETGHLDEASQRWAQLLTLATQRPGQTKSSARTPANDGDTSSEPKLIPPLTLSQFRLTVVIAKAAARNGMTALSQDAVSESLRGGFPVADPGSPNLSELRAYSNMLSSVTASSRVDPIEQEVVDSLREITSLWRGVDYPAEQTYEVLLALVLPPDHPTEIRLYVIATNIMQGRIDSLAEMLVATADNANKLPELLAAVNHRCGETGTEKTVSVDAIRTLIAIRQHDTSTAIGLLGNSAKLIEQGVPSNNVAVIGMVAFEANEVDTLRTATMPILTKLLEIEVQTAARNQNQEMDLGGRLPELVNQHLASIGDAKSVVAYFDTLLRKRQFYYNQYSGDYGLYLQWRDLGKIAEQTASLQMPEVAFEFLGRTTDLDVARYAPPDLSLSLAVVCRHLRTLPLDARYQHWHDWTMPMRGRSVVRSLTAIVKTDSLPSEFQAINTVPGVPHTTRLLSNLTELVAAARDTNRLAELRRETELVAKNKLPNADVLLALISIAQDDIEQATPRIENLFASMKDRLKQEPNQRRQIAFGEYLVLRACLQSKSFVGLVDDRLAWWRQVFMDRQQRELIPMLDVDWLHRVSASGSGEARPAGPPRNRLTNWLASTTDETRGTAPPWWTTQEDQIVHLGGAGRDTLLFRYPLTGDFSVSMDCFEDNWTVGDAGYGGINVIAQQFGPSATIESASGHESIQRPSGMKRGSQNYNRVKIDVADGQMTFLLNGHVVYQEAVGTTSPWLALTSHATNHSLFRNIEFNGSPTISERVELLAGDRMDGWNCSLFGETKPRQRLMSESPERENGRVADKQRAEPSEFDWSTSAGVLNGQPRDNATQADQSWIHYYRQLADSESFRYEFFYIPGQSVAHPTIGRVALLLEPDGVHSHWIGTSDWDESFHGVPLDNSIVEACCQRGPKRLPLKPGQWNRVELKLRDGKAIVSLNDTVVFERPVSSGNAGRNASEEPTDRDTWFGLFRYQTQSSKVRNATLGGDWPSDLTKIISADLLAMNNPVSRDVSQDVGTIVGDAMVASVARDVVRRARELEPAAAYDVLRDWVLPSASHTNIRMAYALHRSHELQTTAEHVLCPAVELVCIAAELGRMDELDAMLDQLAPNDSAQFRNLAAVKALMAMESGNQDAVTMAMKDVWKLMAEGITKDVSVADRAAEYVVAWRAARQPEFWWTANALTQELISIERDGNRTSGDWNFKGEVEALLGDVEMAARTQTWGGPITLGEPLTQWTAVPFWNPELVWRGNRPSRWLASKGSLQHMPGEARSQLYFQSPLRGSFEIEAEHSTYGFREVVIALGMHHAKPEYLLSGVHVDNVNHDRRMISKQLNIPGWGEVATSRFRVNGNTITTFVNDVQIHTQTFAEPLDPWLMMQAEQAGYYGLVNNLRITGTPEIPDEIDLIDTAGLAAWQADWFGESLSADANSVTDPRLAWIRIGDELTGTIDENSEIKFRESRLYYQRPMLADGVIEFETWYEPGKCEVHPSLGRHAYLITPEGLRDHKITDGRYETSGLMPGNTQPITSAVEAIPMRENAWNRVRLSLTGDRLTISVNDAEVATVDVSEPINERHFGLFRYSNQTRCRVRNMVYRGQWPKTLPSIANQELADSDTGPYSIDGTVAKLDLSGDQALDKLIKIGFVRMGPTDDIQPSEDGLRLALHDCQDWRSWLILKREQKIEGDFQLTVDYEDLRIIRAKEGWGQVTGLRMDFGPAQLANVECAITLDGEGKLQYKVHSMNKRPDGESDFHRDIAFAGAPASGRLRMIRQGGQVHCLAAEAGAEQFRLLASFPVGTTPLVGFEYSSKCSDAVGRIDVTLKNFTIEVK